MQNSDVTKLSEIARSAAAMRNWPVVAQHAQAILDIDQESDEGWFLNGRVARAVGNIPLAITQFECSLSLNDKRHDAAIELANLYSKARRNGEAAALIKKYTPLLQRSSRYLDLAGTVSVQIGMPEVAWELYKKANELQPNTPILMSNMANCAIYVGKFEEAEKLFEAIIAIDPTHRQNHFHYSKLVKAKDRTHIDQMLGLLENKDIPENRNTPLYFAIGKEFEDLEDWDKSFEYFQKGNQSVSNIVKYDPKDDLAFIDFIIEKCSAEWMKNADTNADTTDKSPLFIAGLPRTGTTLVERILSSHSKIGTLGETMFVQQAAGQIAREKDAKNTSIFKTEAYGAFMENCEKLPELYIDAAQYRLPDKPIFIEKLPLNFLFLGPIAKAWPNAKIMVLKRGPMDTCYSLYKQVFTWAYKFSYDLDHIGQYYRAYDRLIKHWKDVLGDRLVEVDYETLAQNPDKQIPLLLEKLDVEFEEACLNFHLNESASTTASTVQVRSKISTGSIGKWKNYAPHLEPLRKYLESHGIKT